MTAVERALLATPARPVQVVLEQLVTLRRQSREDPEVEPPKVTLHLNSGARVTGWVLDLFDGKSGKGLLLWEQLEPRGKACDGFYVDPDSIEAITVHGLGDAAHLLSFGAVTRPPNTELTRLEVARRAETWTQKAAERLGPLAFEVRWDAVPVEQAALWAFAQQIKWTCLALAQLAEKAGEQAVRGKVTKLRFEKGDRFAVVLEGDTLVTRVELGAGGGWTLPESVSAISAVL